MPLDRYDLRILNELQRDASQSNQEIADIIGLTPAPCSRRIKHLHDAGYIERQLCLLNPRKLGLHLQAMVHIIMDKHIPERFDAFEQAIGNIPEVTECYLITGHDADYQLRVVVEDMDSYHDILLGKITRIPGVTGVKSSFVMRTIVNSHQLPLKL